MVSRLTRGKIDPSKVLSSVRDPKAGAIVLFLGTVRDNSEAGRVEEMEYEAYAAMAEKRMAEVEKEVRKKWPAVREVEMVHRIGRLKVGDVSVAVAVSAPHRAEAFEACRHVIETIKHEVPIWKRERLAGGGKVWVEGKRLRPRRKAA